MLDHERLIDGLCAEAAPVRRVSPAWRRAAAFIPPMLALGWFLPTILHRTVIAWSVPDTAAAIANAAVSLALGVVIFMRALIISVPGGNLRWGRWIALALVAWLVVALSGMGTPIGLSEAYREGRNCFTFILVAGLPMAALAIAALRRTRSLTPVPSLVTAGAGVAFLSFGLLAFCHPAATTLIDTLGHLAAALVLGALTTLIGLKAIAA